MGLDMSPAGLYNTTCRAWFRIEAHPHSIVKLAIVRGDYSAEIYSEGIYCAGGSYMVLIV